MLAEGQIEGGVHMGLGQALSEEFVVEGGVPADRDAEVAAHRPADRHAGGRVHPRRGAAARGAVRREGRGGGGARPDRGCRRRSALRLRRHSPHPPADEGLTRGAGRSSASCRPAPPEGLCVILAGATVVVSLDPVAVVDGDIVIEDGRIVTIDGPAAAGRAARLLRLRRRPRQRLCAHASLLGPCARHALCPRAAPELPRDPAARLVAPRPRPRRGQRSCLGARRRDGGAALRHHDPDRPPRFAERDRRLARRGRGGARGARGPLDPLLRDVRPRRAASGPLAGVDREPPVPAAGRRERLPLARGMVGAHASFTLSDETLDGLRRRLPPSSVSGCTSTSPRTRSTSADALARVRLRVVERLADAGALDDANAARPLRAPRRRARSASSVRSGATGRPQRALEHEQLGRPRAACGARRAALRSAPTGSAPTCSRSRAPRSSGCARTTLRPAPGWPLARLAAGSTASPAARSASRCSARSSRARRPTSSCSTTRRRRRGRRAPRRALDLRAVGRATSAT